MLFGKRKRNVKRILVIEDEPLTAFDNEVMIKDAGYDVVATHDDFEEAVAALDAVDQHIGGKRPKIPEGLEIYEPGGSAT